MHTLIKVLCGALSTLRATAYAAVRWIRACVAQYKGVRSWRKVCLHRRTELCAPWGGPLVLWDKYPGCSRVHGIHTATRGVLCVWTPALPHMLPRGMHVPLGRSMSARGVRIEPCAATGQRRSVSWTHAARYGAASGVGAWRSSSLRRREARSCMCVKSKLSTWPPLARPPTSWLAEELCGHSPEQIWR